MNQERIGKFILELRTKKKMTQQELGNKIGVTDRAISKWENGRGLPDISLIEPLCKELGITVNELLSGEKIQKEQEKEKFEENIINTLNYSNKKIKTKKRIILSLLSIIIIILLILSTLFIIDINRMKNNKPVLFSTWGYEYAPPLNLDSISLENTIKEYLIKESESNTHHNNEKSFVALKTYLIKETEHNYYVYSWVLEEKYYIENNEIKNDSASSIPHKFELVKDNNEYILIDDTIPRDGGYYEQDMKNLFPLSIRKEMEKSHYDGTIEKLSSEIDYQVKLYFHK